MREVPVTEVAQIIAEKLLGGGMFLTASDGVHNNVMTIGWGGLTTFYGTACFLAPVRTSRHTFGILKKNGAFTVSIPLHDMRRELAFAGSKSGREVDKFSGHGLTAAHAQAVNVPIVKECELHIECEPFGNVALNPSGLTDEVNSRFYPTGDMHTFFLGKIVRCYYTEDVHIILQTQ